MEAMLLGWYLIGLIGWIGFCVTAGSISVGDLVACLFVGFTGPFLFLLLGLFYVCKTMDHLFSVVLWRRK